MTTYWNAAACRSNILSIFRPSGDLRLVNDGCQSSPFVTKPGHYSVSGNSCWGWCLTFGVTQITLTTVLCPSWGVCKAGLACLFWASLYLTLSKGHVVQRQGRSH